MSIKTAVFILDMNPVWDGHLGWQMGPLALRIKSFVCNIPPSIWIVRALFQNISNSPFQHILQWDKMKEDPCVHPQLEHFGEHRVYHGYSAAPLLSQSESEEVGQILLCGIFSDVSILKTALDLLEMGIKPVVLSDLCATPHGDEIHHACMKSLRHSIGARGVVTAAEWEW